MSATQTTSQLDSFTATTEALSNGRQRITILRDGEVWDTRTTANPYAVVNILQVRDEDREMMCPRYSRKPLPVGRRTEYGVCIGSVLITEAVAAPEAPQGPVSLCAFPDCIHHLSA